jgi:4-diphosphocytidyl-2-C-methyl-D-erythritol kinase
VTRLLAPAKVTLRLAVTGVRPDGYHLIDAEMVTVDLYDELEVETADESSLVIEPAGGGLAVAAGPDNLVLRALAVAGRTAAVRLRKVIPAGAGLGGGSADAAAILRWAGVGDAALAAGLGADVPFCLRGGRARVGGIGERVEPLAPERLVLTLLTPPFGLPTPAVYAAWDELGGPRHPGNDLTPAALAVRPELEDYRRGLAEATGQEPVLAGSGGTWFVPGDHPQVRVGDVTARVVRAVVTPE